MPYSGVFVFGDSLVDSGNALRLANWYDDLPFTALPDGAPTAADGYFAGRFSNGYNFADLLSNKLIGAVTKPVFPYGYEDPWLGIPIAPWASDPNGHNLNFAYGGSHIIRGDEAVPDFDEQTDAFRHAVDGDADPNALYLITLGGNDVRDLAPTASNPVPQAEAYEALEDAADKMLHELSQLVDIDAHNFVIIGLADVGLIPRYDRNDDGVLDATELMRSAAATDYSQYLDALIRTEVIPALEALGADVTYVPLMDYVDASGHLVTGALNANLPTLAALYGLTTEELSQNLLEHKDLIFFDHVHPTAQANALLGAFIAAQVNGTPWIETLPLTGVDVDYRTTASIAAPAEVDGLVLSLVAGTIYRFEMLGISTLATAGTLGDPTLRLLGSGGNLIGADDDSGVGFDASLTFTAATTGNYTLQLSAVGSLTGSYSLQAAVVSGTAMQAGNTYVVNNASTLVLESVDGVGQDVVKASISYALTAGSEIEVLRTTSDRGKTAIDLTGNEFGQTIVGNAGANRIEGKAGADVMTGGAGKDIFVLSKSAVTDPGAANIDRITDYGSGDVIDITQILSVAAGTNVAAGQFARVTTNGLIQVDLDGGGNSWITLSNINNGGAVTVRYLSGGVATNVSLSRVAANSNMAIAGAVAAAGLMSVPAAAETVASANDGLAASGPALLNGGVAAAKASVDGPSRSVIAGESREPVEEQALASSANQGGHFVTHGADANGLVPADKAPLAHLTELLQGTDDPATGIHSAGAPLVAAAVAMPSAELLQAAAGQDGAGADGKSGHWPAAVAHILAEALAGDSASVDALLDALPSQARAPEAAIEAIATHPAGSWDHADFPVFVTAHQSSAMELLALHPDVAPAA